MPEATTIATMRQINAMMLEMKDSIVGMLIGKDEMSALLMQRIRGQLKALQEENYGTQMKEVLSEHAAWQYEKGIGEIDQLLKGAGVAEVLRVPKTNVEMAGSFIADKIVTIPQDAIARVSRTLAMMSLGQKAPSLVAESIARDFDMTRSHAETIVRTEGKKLQNFGAEARIQDASTAAKKQGLAMNRIWLHNTASEEIEAMRAAAIATHKKSKLAGKGLWSKQQPYTPRPHHKAMHLVTVPAEEKFKLRNLRGDTWEVDGPHDPILPAEEVINCHCDRAIRIDREKLKAWRPKPAEDTPQPEPQPVDPVEVTPTIAADVAPRGTIVGPLTGMASAARVKKPVITEPVFPNVEPNTSAPWGKPLEESKLLAIDPHKTEPSWELPKKGWWKNRSYGAVMMDDDGRILLREPTGNFGGYSWTFPKGGLAHSKEHPLLAAMREVGEETGYSGQVMGLVPGTFVGDSTRTNFFLMRPGKHDPSLMDAETSGLRWVTPAEAEELIMQTKNTRGRKRDLAILKAAVDERDMIVTGKQTYAHLFGEGPAPVRGPAPRMDAEPENFPGSTEGLKVVRRLGGSTGAQLVEDPATGKQYVMKRGASPEHLLEEVNADAAYQALGVKVPAFKVYTQDGAPVKLAEFIPEARTLADIMRKGKPAEIDRLFKQLGEDFTADALLGNWDVVGLEFDNILVDKAGTAWRIDNGGSLRYRAQGARKRPEEFSADVTELETMRQPGKNAAAARVFSRVTDADIDQQIARIVQRKQALLDALPADLRPVISARLGSLEARLTPAWFSEAEVKAIADARVLGRTYLGDAQSIEDNAILIWQETRNGQPVIKAQFKVTKAGLEKIVPELRVARGSKTAVTMPDPYWDSILAAAKTVNHHQADGMYNVTTLEKLADTKKMLLSVTATSDPNVAAMKDHYLKAIEQITASISKKSITGQIDRFVPVVQKPKRIKQPAGTLDVKTEPMVFMQKERVKGHATELGNSIFKIPNALRVTSPEGVTIRYVPQDHTIGFSFRGTVQLELPSAVTKDALEKMIGSVKHIGIDARPATKEDLDVSYIAKHLNLYARGMTAEQKTQWRGIVQSDLPAAEKARELRAWTKSNIKLDIPEGVDLSGTANAFGYGWKRWMRADLSAETIEKEMKEYTLVHATDRNVAMLVESFLNGGGQVTPTAERLRTGVPLDSGGMSPLPDTKTGGSDYWFTRIAKRGTRRGQIEFKIRNLARLDAWSFERDRFGDMRYGDDNLGPREAGDHRRPDADQVRYHTIEEYKRISQVSDNETLFKHGLSLIDDVERVRASSASERQTIINLFKKHGYATLPDGRKIEEVVVH